MNLKAHLVKRVDAYASELNINRTAAISILLTQAFENQEVIKAAQFLPGIIDDIKAMQAGTPNSNIQMRLKA
jgi:hypothetical protein